MAGLATGCWAAGLHLQHALFELSAMRVGVTARAAQVVPVVNGRRRLEFRRLLVAVHARDSDVRAGEHEPGLLVLNQ